MPQNQILPFANGVGANTLSEAQWAALGTLLAGGFQSGVALSVQINTLFRQLSVPVSGIAQFVADNQTQDVLDDGVPANFETKFKAALLSAVEGEGIAYVADTGSTDALVGTPSPALTAYRTGQVIAVQKNASVGANATTSPTINLNGLGAVTITKSGGGPLAIGDLPQGGDFFAILDGNNNFRRIGLVASDVLALIGSQTRINAPGPITLYVRTDGSDSNNGLTDTSAGAFATLQAAYNYLTKSFNPGFTATIQIGIAGTYAGFTASNAGIAGTINVQGVSNGSSPTSYIIAPVTPGDGSYASAIVSIQTVSFVGVTFDGSSATTGLVVLQRVSAGAATTANNCIYRYSGNNANCNPIVIDSGGSFTFAGPCTFALGTVGNVISNNGTFGGGPIGGAAITINNATFASFLYVSGGYVNLQYLTFSGTGNTGLQFNVQGGYVNPAAVALSSIPGSVTGTVQFPAGYIPGFTGVPWSTYNPAVAAQAGTIGSSSYIARYFRDANTKRVTGYVQVTIGSAGTGSGGVEFNLPVPSLNSEAAYGVEVGNTNKELSVRSANSSLMLAYFYDGSTPIANGSILIMHFTYEAAN